MRSDKAKRAIRDVVIANRILAHEDIVDAYGHVSHRNPDDPGSFFISRSLAPELVEESDIVELDLQANPVDPSEKRSLYLERFIHAAVLSRRPEVNAVIHAHAEAVLPFCVVDDIPLRPVIHSGSFAGAHVPLWDIANKFGDTDLLVSNMDQGLDLTETLARGKVALMRGHGFTACGESLIDVVRIAVYLPRNAQVLSTARMMGGSIKYLSAGEIMARQSEKYAPNSVATRRAWDYWAARCGCSHLLDLSGT